MAYGMRNRSSSRPSWLQEAEEAFVRAISLRPDYPEALMNLATVRRNPSCQNGIIPLSSLPQTSNNIIQKGLAFVRERSGSMTVPGTKRASGSCPAGCMAEVGLRWWRRTTPHQRKGGSRCQDSPIRSS
jgi:hypothetical protein